MIRGWFNGPDREARDHCSPAMARGYNRRGGHGPSGARVPKRGRGCPMKIPGALAALARGLRGRGGWRRGRACAPRGRTPGWGPHRARRRPRTSCSSTPNRGCLPALVVLDQAIRADPRGSRGASRVLSHRVPRLALFDGDDPQLELRARLRRKYAGSSIDLIVAAASPSLRFAVHHRADLFSGVPVVFAAVDQAAVAGLAARRRHHGDLAGPRLGGDPRGRRPPSAREPARGGDRGIVTGARSPSGWRPPASNSRPTRPGWRSATWPTACWMRC